MSYEAGAGSMREMASMYNIYFKIFQNWRYESEGTDALKNRRGLKKNEEELTPEERVALQVKRLEAENERLRAENAFLKKLEKLERRRS
jgi:transposase